MENIGNYTACAFTQRMLRVETLWQDAVDFFTRFEKSLDDESTPGTLGFEADGGLLDLAFRYAECSPNVKATVFVGLEGFGVSFGLDREFDDAATEFSSAREKRGELTYNSFFAPYSMCDKVDGSRLWRPQLIVERDPADGKRIVTLIGIER